MLVLQRLRLRYSPSAQETTQLCQNPDHRIQVMDEDALPAVLVHKRPGHQARRKVDGFPKRLGLADEDTTRLRSPWCIQRRSARNYCCEFLKLICPLRRVLGQFVLISYRVRRVTSLSNLVTMLVSSIKRENRIKHDRLLAISEET
jgi:hypothetical protein